MLNLKRIKIDLFNVLTVTSAAFHVVYIYCHMARSGIKIKTKCLGAAIQYAPLLINQPRWT